LHHQPRFKLISNKQAFQNKEAAPKQGSFFSFSHIQKEPSGITWTALEFSFQSNYFLGASFSFFEASLCFLVDFLGVASFFSVAGAAVDFSAGFICSVFAGSFFWFCLDVSGLFWLNATVVKKTIPNKNANFFIFQDFMKLFICAAKEE
jgi:hypothetical protein